MIRQTVACIAPRPRGFGLMEVLVGLSVGIFLLGAVSYLFLGSRQLDRAQTDLSRMQESGRIALEILGRPVRQAGAMADDGTVFTGTALTGTEGTSGAPDTLTVSYAAQDGGEVNCLGSTVAAKATATFVFSVDANNKTLICGDGTGATVVVMDNIENMQITYGIDTDPDPERAIISSYQSASGLTATQMNTQVGAVRVSLLVAGPTEGVVATNAQTFTYDGSSVTRTDRFLRQVFTSTFTLRNRAL